MFRSVRFHRLTRPAAGALLGVALAAIPGAHPSDAPEKADKKILTLAGARTVAAAAEAEAAKGGATPAFAIAPATLNWPTVKTCADLVTPAGGTHVCSSSGASFSGVQGSFSNVGG